MHLSNSCERGLGCSPAGTAKGLAWTGPAFVWSTAAGQARRQSAQTGVLPFELGMSCSSLGFSRNVVELRISCRNVVELRISCRNVAELRISSAEAQCHQHRSERFLQALLPNNRAVNLSICTDV